MSVGSEISSQCNHLDLPFHVEEDHSVQLTKEEGIKFFQKLVNLRKEQLYINEHEF